MKYLFIICVCIMARRVPLISSLPLGEPVAGMSGLNSGQKHFKSVIDKYSDIIDKAYKKKKNNNRKPKRKSKPKNLDLRTMLRKGMLRKERKPKKRCVALFIGRTRHTLVYLIDVRPTLLNRKAWSLKFCCHGSHDVNADRK